MPLLQTVLSGETLQVSLYTRSVIVLYTVYTVLIVSIIIFHLIEFFCKTNATVKLFKVNKWLVLLHEWF